MRKRTLPVILFVFAFAFLGLGLLLSQQNQEEAKFQKVMDAYLDAYWKFYPTAATMAGYHKYDDKLEDLSEKNIEKEPEEPPDQRVRFIGRPDEVRHRKGESPSRLHQAGQDQPPDPAPDLYRNGHQAVPRDHGFLQGRCAQADRRG